MDARHFDQIPKEMSASKYYYALNHAGETTGKCRICNSPTEFDEPTGRVRVLCGSEKCKTAFSVMASERNMKKFGVPHLLNSQTHQMYMLSKRKISGEYLWSDGHTKIPYVGSYEKRFLEFLDNFLSFSPSTIHSPCPITIYYEYNGEMLSHTPDFYNDILDLIVEIKHGGDNPNTHPKIQAVDVAKDKAKEMAIRTTTTHNYIKITDNNFAPFIKLLFKLTENEQNGRKERYVVINENVLAGLVIGYGRVRDIQGQELMDLEPILYDETPLLEAIDPMDVWMHDMTRYANKMFGNDDSKGLFFHFFAHILPTGVGHVTITITLQDSFTNMIHYDGERFFYISKDKVNELKKTFLSTFRYNGDLDVTKEINTLKDMIKNKTVLKEPDDVNAIAHVFKILFDKKAHYTPMDIALSPDFVKYRELRRNKGMDGRNDDVDLLSFVDVH